MPPLQRTTKFHQSLSWWVLGLLPLSGIAYLRVIASQSWQLKAYIFHELSILFAVGLAALFMTIAYRNFKKTEDTYYQSVILGLLSFIIVFLPHGLLTNFSDQNQILFLAFGPLSRAIVSIYLFFGLLQQPHAKRRNKAQKRSIQWTHHLVFFVICDVLLFISAGFLNWLTVTHLRIFEAIALSFFGMSLLVLLRKSHRPFSQHLKLMFFLFIQVSIAFLLAYPWNYLWWFAHGISLAGFLILGYTTILYSKDIQTV